MIYSYKKEFDKYYNDFVKNLGDRLLIWVEYESKKTYVYYDKKELQLDYVLSSTYLIMKMLEEKEIL